MNTTRLAALLISTVAVAGAAHAQSAPSASTPTPVADASAPVGKQAGTFLLRFRAIGVLPENLSSAVTPIGGSVNATATAAPELDLSYFITDNIAVEGIAATTRHDISAGHTVIGHVDVGSVWVLPPTVTLQYHFMPQSRFSPYVGAGGTVAFFYDSQPAGPTVTKVGFTNNVGPAIQAGFDYNFNGPWFANFDVKQVFVNTTAHINGTIHARTSLDPTIVGAGIGYRF